jgi:hypothetical protein
MRRTKAVMVAMLWAGLLLAGSLAHAQQVKGTVVNRDGAVQPGCQVTFAGPATYSVWTNSAGVFFLEGPRHGEYEVTVKQGDRRQVLKVMVNQYGLNPSTLVVPW